MPYASIDGTELFYTLIGQGEPCLVMHGEMGSEHTMVHPGLNSLEDVFQLVYDDHRGNSRSGHLPIETLAWELLGTMPRGVARIVHEASAASADTRLSRVVGQGP